MCVCVLGGGIIKIDAHPRAHTGVRSPEHVSAWGLRSVSLCCSVEKPQEI